MNYTTMAATPMMEKAGLSFPDLIDFARSAINVLQTAGESVIGVLESGFKAWSAISNRDLSGVLTAFGDAQRSVEKIIEAIRAEFEI